jgi:hypothetical protein
MKYPNTYKLRYSDEMKHYFDVLRTLYSINIAQFTRRAIVEKLQRDMPTIRADYKKKRIKTYHFN